MQENNLYQCQLCNFKTIRLSSLMRHIHNKHNILSEQYYNKYGITGKKDNRCKICCKLTKYLNFFKGYAITCSIECAKIYKRNNCLKKFGVEYPLQSKQIQTKIKETNLKKYGVKNQFQNKQTCIKIKKTNLKRYGVENPFQNKQIQNKTKETNLKRYGVENIFQLQKIKQKIKQTNLKKYKVENPFQAQEIKQKIKQTYLNKYGVEHPMQNKQIFNKVMSSFNQATRLKQYNYNGHIIHYQTKPQLQFINLCQQLGYQIYDGPGIKYQFQGKKHITYPDFLLQYFDKNKRIIQIKGNHKFYKQQVKSGKFQAKCNAIKEYSKQNQYLDFIVVMYN